MCLGVPGRVVDVVRHGVGIQMGRVQFGGIQKEVCLSFLPDIQRGDYVIVHAGFAISRIDEDEAAKTLEILREMGEVADLTENGTRPTTAGDAVR